MLRRPSAYPRASYPQSVMPKAVPKRTSLTSTQQAVKMQVLKEVSAQIGKLDLTPRTYKCYFHLLGMVSEYGAKEISCRSLSTEINRQMSYISHMSVNESLREMEAKGLIERKLQGGNRGALIKLKNPWKKQAKTKGMYRELIKTRKK
jgi:predicted transcriptional regulator